MFWKLIKGLIYLSILGAVALVAFALVGDYLFPSDFAAPEPPQGETVTLSPQG